MAFNCNFCGFRNSEVKAGGSVPTYGTEISLLVTSIGIRSWLFSESIDWLIYVLMVFIVFSHHTDSISYHLIDDLKRDVLKSDSTVVHIPEIDLELQSGTLGLLIIICVIVINTIYLFASSQVVFILRLRVCWRKYIHHFENQIHSLLETQAVYIILLLMRFPIYQLFV